MAVVQAPTMKQFSAPFRRRPFNLPPRTGFQQPDTHSAAAAPGPPSRDVARILRLHESPPFIRRSAKGSIDRQKKRSGRHASRPRREGITPVFPTVLIFDHSGFVTQFISSVPAAWKTDSIEPCQIHRTSSRLTRPLNDLILLATVPLRGSKGNAVRT